MPTSTTDYLQQESCQSLLPLSQAMKPTPHDLIQAGEALRFLITPTAGKERGSPSPCATDRDTLGRAGHPNGGGDHRGTAESVQGIPTKANAWVGF